MKRFYLFCIALIVSLLLLFVFRNAILLTLGNYLIAEDRPDKVNAIFVLSGGSVERGIEAAKMLKEGYATQVYTTGGLISQSLLAAGLDSLKDAVLTKKVIKSKLDSATLEQVQLHSLPYGTSTFEESEEILGFSRQKGFSKIMVISSSFHTRRVAQTFVKKFKKAGIRVLVKGAAPLNYATNKWWESEEGLIFVNNEYTKIVYYMLKH